MKKGRDYTADNEQFARFTKSLRHPARATVSQHLKELKDAGFIQGEIEPPKVKYCINKDNFALAKQLFAIFFERANGHKNYCK